MKRKDMASSGSSSEELHNQLGSPHKRQLKMELKMEGSTGRRKPHPIAFILFLEDFRKRRMEEFESALQKDAAKEWDSLFEVEKMTYEKKAMEKVAALEKGLEIYNKLG